MIKRTITILLTIVMVMTSSLVAFADTVGTSDNNANDTVKSRSVDNDADSTKTDTATEKKTVKKTTVKRPTNVRAINTGRKCIKVKWNRVKGAKGYIVYRATKKNGNYKSIKRIKSGSKRTYRDEKVKLNKSYYYKVKAYKTKNSKRICSQKSKRAYAYSKLKYRKKITVKSYAYTGGGTTASGKKAKVGRIAVDPRVIPIGTKLYIKGYGFCEACDTGGAIKGKVVDLYMNSNAACDRWGVRYKTVYFLD